MAIDFTTPVGKCRLITGDTTEGLFFCPDSVYESTLLDNNGSVGQASKVIAFYILAQLAQQSNVVLGALSIFDGNTFKAYKEYITMISKGAATGMVSPIPYGGGINDPNKVVEAYETWNNNDNTRFLRESVKDVNPCWPSL